MAALYVTINGRVFEADVPEAQVARGEALGKYLDSRAQKLLATVGPVSDTQLLFMLGLLLADELAEAHAALAKQKK